MLGEPPGVRALKARVRDAGDGPYARPDRHIPDRRLAHESERSYPALPSRRIALGFGTAAGAAVIAASFSMGTAPVAGADVSDADAVSSLVGALDPSAFSAASVADTAMAVGVPDAAETVPSADAISYLIDALDPTSSPPRAHRRACLGLWATTLTRTCTGPTPFLFR